jgi:hypothetical protein
MTKLVTNERQHHFQVNLISSTSQLCSNIPSYPLFSTSAAHIHYFLKVCNTYIVGKNMVPAGEVRGQMGRETLSCSAVDP